jgi:hypothetical protein
MTSICHKRNDSQVPRPLDGFGQLALVNRANPANPARENLAALRIEVGKQLPVFVVNVGDFLSAELADSLAPDCKSFSLCHDL